MMISADSRGAVHKSSFLSQLLCEFPFTSQVDTDCCARSSCAIVIAPNLWHYGTMDVTLNLGLDGFGLSVALSVGRCV